MNAELFKIPCENATLGTAFKFVVFIRQAMKKKNK